MPSSLPGGVAERRNPLRFVMAMALVVALACPIGSVQAQALWRDSAVGMGVEQVRERFPDAVVPDAPDVLYSGAKERLRIPELELAGHRFEASFFFLGGRLTQVMLGLLDAANGDVARQAFDAVAQTLRKEYGDELTTESTTGLVTKSRSTWRSGPTHIVLLHMVVGRADPLLNLVYQELPPDP